MQNTHHIQIMRIANEQRDSLYITYKFEDGAQYNFEDNEIFEFNEL